MAKEWLKNRLLSYNLFRPSISPMEPFFRFVDRCEARFKTFRMPFLKIRIKLKASILR
jgi:hypothetical protein